jgi:hypothetical protein
MVSQNKYLKEYGIERKENELDPEKYYNYSYSFADLSTEYICVNLFGTGYSELLHSDNLKFRKFRGIQPSFTPDGHYLLCLDGKNLRLYPVHEKELIRLAIDKSIFGKLYPNLTEWRHFLKDW